MNVQSFAHARSLSRQFFPTWSRRARARWVLANAASLSSAVFQHLQRRTSVVQWALAILGIRI